MKASKEKSERAVQNIKSIIEEEIKQSIEAGDIPPDIAIEGIRLYSDLIEVDLSNNTTMQIELGLPH